MGYLLIGLALFLGVHSFRIFFPDWRQARIRQWGEGPWKLAISAASIAAFLLLIWGYKQAGGQPLLLWAPPSGLRPVAGLLTLAGFVLVVAAYVPRNHFKFWWGHPMVLGIMLWALAHLLVNGWLRGVVLFGGFLLWAALSFRSARARDRAAGLVPAAGEALASLIAVVLGAAAWAGFAFYLHAHWIGVAPFG